jgi:hypothetical protein
VNLRSRRLAVVAGAALALIISATAFGYAGQVVVTLTISGPTGPVPCGTPVTFQATALDVNGNPIEGQPVHWSFSSSPSNKDRIRPRTSRTDANGVATTTVTLACVAGQRTLTAAADKARANAVLTVGVPTFGGAVLGVTGLPGTSTAFDGGPASRLPLASILAVLAVLAGGGVIGRRLALRPR